MAMASGLRKGTVKNNASTKPMTPVKSLSPMTPVRTASPFPQPLRGKEMGSTHKLTYQKPPAQKGDSARLAKASGINLPADALTGSKKFGKHVGCA